MHTLSRGVLVAAFVGMANAGCGDFLSDVADDPNNPTVATRDQRFTAVQAGQFGQQEATIALTICMWMQQCSGVGGRFVEDLDGYGIDESSHSFDFTSVYVGGGLIDLRAIEASAEADGDRVYAGIAKVWEAFVIGTAASIWGDLPYREAAGDVATPALDPQAQVYADLQALLDEAITDLGGAGQGPGPRDLVYGGDKVKWIALANTLKARYHMHTAERLGAAAYNAAIAAADLGISDTADDFRAFHATATQEANLWYQFSTTTFGQDVVAGKFLADLMNARSDPRRPAYFGLNELGGYGGNDVNGATPAADVSPLRGLRNKPEFRQPLATWAENQLILAEAKFQTSGAAAAQPHLDAVRASVPLASVPATLQSIMEEKYVALFQNIEAWSDYRRTCIPALNPVATSLFLNRVPGRLFYGSSEASVNTNVPTEAQQLSTNEFRNANDPNPCP